MRTYKGDHTLQMTFGGKAIEVEVEITQDEWTDDGQNGAGTGRLTYSREYDILSIRDREGNLLWHKGNGKPQVGSISPELRKAIEDEADKVEVLYE